MTTVFERQCPACDRLAWVDELHEQRFAKIDGVSVLDRYSVVVCACGMVFASNIPPQSAFDLYYMDASKYDGAASPRDISRLSMVADDVADVFQDRGARVLDVGCADGALLGLLRSKGFSRVAGVDPSARAVARAYEHYGVDARQGTITGLEQWAEQYDVITLVGVLEHVRDVGPALRVLRSRLAPGGALYVEVPDAGAFTPAGTAPFQEFSAEHLNFWDRDTLAATAARHGFTLTWQRSQYRMGPGQWLMPTLCAVLARADGPRLAVEAYIRASEGIDGAYRATWDEWAGGGRPFYVWGVGALTLRLLAASAHGVGSCVGFIDSNPRYHGKTLMGCIIGPPDSFAVVPLPILIGTVAHAEEIENEIRVRFPNCEVVRLWRG